MGDRDGVRFNAVDLTDIPPVEGAPAGAAPGLPQLGADESRWRPGARPRPIVAGRGD